MFEVVFSSEVLESRRLGTATALLTLMRSTKVQVQQYFLLHGFQARHLCVVTCDGTLNSFLTVFAMREAGVPSRALSCSRTGGCRTTSVIANPLGHARAPATDCTLCGHAPWSALPRSPEGRPSRCAPSRAGPSQRSRWHSWRNGRGGNRSDYRELKDAAAARPKDSRADWKINQQFQQHCSELR